MHHEYHRWYSDRVERDMGINVYGHFGTPVLVFPTSGGDEHEYAQREMIASVSHHIDAGKAKLYCISSVNHDSWYNQGAHPSHRVYKQARYDDYVANEVVPFIRAHCSSPDIPITTTGASFGAFHAVNSLLKHPDAFNRCIAQSGVYDMRCLMDGHYDENFYFNNPVDYMAGLDDPWFVERLRRCDIRLITGTGEWEDSSTTHQLAGTIRSKGIPVSVDDWGPDGGHDWPYWKRQIEVYIGRL